MITKIEYLHRQGLKIKQTKQFAATNLNTSILGALILDVLGLFSRQMYPYGFIAVGVFLLDVVEQI
ncbi:MAG: hypothetical protein H9855_11400 [Candidatus Acinetobacter avistercoris]|uniref:hypothetical protein n=1 Tax=Acinetobacter sp. KS-LM10 TaxID=3120518 RepID=UPI001FA0808F|nr:hypothetical protein [Candidatus Acinetobacter avistercoris]